MKLMERNKKLVRYCLCNKVTPVVDEYGNLTGERVVEYGPVREARVSISDTAGAVQIEQFGTYDGYDRVIITDDMECPIKEGSVLFVEKAPEFDKAGNPLYDYQVSLRAPSLNHISFAIKKVVVS